MAAAAEAEESRCRTNWFRQPRARQAEAFEKGMPLVSMIPAFTNILASAPVWGSRIRCYLLLVYLVVAGDSQARLRQN